MPQPLKYKRTSKATGFSGPPIPADIEAHNKMAREATASGDDNKYARKPMAVSLAGGRSRMVVKDEYDAEKKSWNE